MDTRIEGLITLIDEALGIAEERLKNLQAGRPDPSSPDSLNIIIAGLRYRRDEAINGRLEPSKGYDGTLEGHGTLGLARVAAEHDRYDTSLMKKTGEIEKYYQENL